MTGGFESGAPGITTRSEREVCVTESRNLVAEAGPAKLVLGG